MYCNYCGGQNPDDAVYCSHCARTLRPETEAAGAAPGRVPLTGEAPPPQGRVPLTGEAPPPQGRVPLTGDPLPPEAPAPTAGQAPPYQAGAIPPGAAMGVPYTCAVCGYVLAAYDQTCARCKTPRGMRVNPNVAMPGAYMPVAGMSGFDNTSGMRTSVPPGVAGGWNWGAFWFSWIWGLNHKVYITLTTLAVQAISFAFSAAMPGGGGQAVNALFNVVNIGLAIWFGIKGNEWAWQNRRFESVEQFRRVQRIWAYWVLGIFLTLVALVVIGIGLAVLATGGLAPR